LYGEVVFAAILAAASSFNSTFVLRAGGSATLVGLLSSLPALVAVFLFLPAGQILERRATYRSLVVWSLFGARIGYLALAVMPFFASQGVAEASVAVLVAMSIPSVFFSTGWNPLLADVIPERHRARVFASRSILSSATIAILTYLLGLALDAGTFPTNYQWLYVFGLAGGLVSVLLVAGVRVPDPAPTETPVIHPRVPLTRGIREAMAESPQLARLTVNTLVYNLGAWMIGPLYIVFYVKELGAADSWIGLHTALVHVGVVLGYWLWRRVNQRMGDSPALLLALPFVAAYPLLVAALPHLSILLVIGLLGHLFIPGVDLNHSLIFMRSIPTVRRHTGIAFYSMVMNLGAFVCPIAGVALAGLIGVRNALVVGGAMRLIGVLMFWVFPVEKERLTWQGVRKGLGALRPGKGGVV